MLVVDNESYFTLSGSNMPANRGSYTSNKDQTPNEIKCYGEEKFGPKILIWVALSEATSVKFLLRKVAIR